MGRLGGCDRGTGDLGTGERGLGDRRLGTGRLGDLGTWDWETETMGLREEHKVWHLTLGT